MMTQKLYVHVHEEHQDFGPRLNTICLSPYPDDIADVVAWGEEFYGDVSDEELKLFQMFAAAPELLAALEAIVAQAATIPYGPLWVALSEEIEAARAAIAAYDAPEQGNGDLSVYERNADLFAEGMGTE